ncbi:hypothetical protein [Flavobacterium pallidum]|uniref:Uncharacterized protein n=1 Tax=Flavobacterium pallidum TaxID=2172098 RepID=A0A2S1SE13_9FLAO|nr:hypothetical protein [Flavobacterium pallidum]AWI24629.1 hypothetical protein HYN49_01275 [Flavobacterium pallidum]
MTRDQEAFFAMALKVKNYGTKNAASMTAIPAVAALYTQLGTHITQLIAADTGSRADLTGYAVGKETKRQALIALGIKVTNAVTSYAVMNSDPVLRNRADFTMSSWEKISEDALISQASIVKNLATPLGAALVPFGAAVADITALGTALTAFIDSVSDPSLAIDQRKIDNRQVAALIGNIRDLFDDKLDVLMRSFAVNNPTVYNLYQSARAIDLNGAVQSPTSTVTVPPATVMTVHTAASYDPDTFYTLQNQGPDALQCSLSTASDHEGPEPVLLLPGETRARLAANLAPSGTFLVANNPGNVAVVLKIWVE